MIRKHCSTASFEGYRYVKLSRSELWWCGVQQCSPLTSKPMQDSLDMTLAGEGEVLAVFWSLISRWRLGHDFFLNVHLAACPWRGQRKIPYFCQAVDSDVCWYLQVWGIFYCRWWEQDLPSALRCFLTSATHIVYVL